VVERVVWKGSKEVEEWEKSERMVKSKYLNSLEMEGVEQPSGGDGVGASVVWVEETEDESFWRNDEGLEEIRKIGKRA
jgi:hypothetical protein